MSQHSTPPIATTAAAGESSVETGPSASGSLKKQKNKNAEVTLTDDFVLLSTPEKFKDKNINESNVVKRRHCDSSSSHDKINLDCLLLSDTAEQCGGTPQHVENLLQHFASIRLSQAEILFLLVYVVALESGFVSQSEYEQVKMHVNRLPATCSFHAKNVLRLSRLKPSYKVTADNTRFTLKLCSLIDVEHESSDYLYALLTGFVTGDFLIVTLSPTNSTGAPGYSTSLSIGRFVLSVQAKNKPLYLRFRKLDELSNVLRNRLFVPMRCQHVVWLECCIYPSLDGLPAELYDHILKYLTPNQLRIVANVNKSLHLVTKSSKFMQQSGTGLD